MKRNYRKIVLSFLLFVLVGVFAACQNPTQVKTDNPTTTGSSQTVVDTKTKTQVQSSKPAITKPLKTKPAATLPTETGLASIKVSEAGRYSTKLEVAAYLYRFKKLPSNFITKNKAMDLGWVAAKGNLWKVTDKMSIGGDKFGNFEKLLPTQKGRQYYEADIDYKGGNRGAKRLVYSNDGLIYYTDDHYNTFEKLD